MPREAKALHILITCTELAAFDGITDGEIYNNLIAYLYAIPGKGNILDLSSYPYSLLSIL